MGPTGSLQAGTRYGTVHEGRRVGTYNYSKRAERAHLPLYSGSLGLTIGYLGLTRCISDSPLTHARRGKPKAGAREVMYRLCIGYV